MSMEGQDIERKSLRIISGRSTDWDEVARQCVCFANAQGGRLLIGIEDNAEHPPQGQRVPVEMVERVRRRIGELTVNVAAAVQRLIDDETQSDYLEVSVSRSVSHASTTDGGPVKTFV